MSEKIKTKVEEEEAMMKALGEFANSCYNKGAKDVLIGVGIGAAFSALIIFGIKAVDLWKDRREPKKQIKEFGKYVDNLKDGDLKIES